MPPREKDRKMWSEHRLLLALASAIFFSRSSRRASSSGIDIPSGTSAWIGGFGLRQKLRNLGLQLRLDFASMLIRKRVVLAGVGVNFRPVQAYRPQLQQAHLMRQKQNLDEQRLDLL